MKALILWGEERSANLGVRALGAGTEAILRRIDPAVEVSRQGYGPGDAPVRIGSHRSQLRRLIRDTDGLTDWVRQFDLVLDTRAGDSFADIYGLQRLWTMNLMSEIVGRARVPIVYSPQTIGPFGTRRGRLLGRRALGTATAVMARDRRSAEVAAELRRPVELLTTDVVFALDQLVALKTHDILLNVSGLLWQPNPHVDHLGYRRFLSQLFQQVQRSGRHVTLLAHVIDSPDPDNDEPACREFADQVAEAGDDRPEILVPTSLDDVRAKIATAELVIGSRMHACLNALSLGVPAIPLAYSRKFAPLLEAIDGPDSIDLKRQSDSAIDRVLETMDDPKAPDRAGAVRDRAQELLEPVPRLLERVVA
ncbi:polysaccharide pyruvyl transferase family protein [Microlunatus soli]|uniref:Polysaccharide pyruvyl transferase family protein WcaK n=1 Tax=Microlunatus soli TaxID=630515 RepID=A0A1H1SS34_9ACTN|nr:polysaccharide pyruvyl transferase family protein [Microlunatus soli]SDS50209.1 Polysaccharide pyruvyl transferase family protein WcaK [Microlunatus soli]